MGNQQSNCNDDESECSFVNGWISLFFSFVKSYSEPRTLCGIRNTTRRIHAATKGPALFSLLRNWTMMAMTQKMNATRDLLSVRSFPKGQPDQ